MGYIVIGLGSITYSGKKTNENLAYRYIKKVFEGSKNEYFNIKHDKCSHTFEMSGNKGIDYEDMDKIQDFLHSLRVKYEIVVNEFVESGDYGFYVNSEDGYI